MVYGSELAAQKKRTAALAKAMTGTQPVLASNPAPMQAMGNPSGFSPNPGIVSAMGTTDKPAYTSQPLKPMLPNNYGFNELASYEEKRRQALGPEAENRIGQLRTGIQSTYDTALKGYQDTTAQRRSALSSSLSDYANKQFEQENPAILEDLNTRGFLSSPTEVARAQAQAQKELALANQSKLFDFDTQSRGVEDSISQQRLADLNELSKAGTSAGLQANQDALDAALDLRRGQLEGKLSEAQSQREDQQARDLASQQRKQGITTALIGAGGSLLPSLLGGGKDGGGLLSGLFSGGGNTAVGTAVTGAGHPASSVLGGEIGSVGTPSRCRGCRGTRCL